MTAAQQPVGAAKWGIVAASAAGLIVGNGAIMQFTFGILLKPVAQGLGISRGTASAALSAGLFATAMAVPFMGRAMDRYGTRAVAMPAILIFAVATAITGMLAWNAASIILGYLIMGLAAAGQTPTGYARAIVTWFDRQRGLALGIAMAGVGIGSAVVPVITSHIITEFGWRSAYFGLAAMIAIVALPASWAALRDGPLLPKDRSRPPAAEARAARRSPTFLRLAAAFTLVALAANGTIAHVVPLLTDRGMAPAAAAFALVPVGTALVLGRLLAGPALDRFDPQRITAIFFSLTAAGVALLAWPGASPSLAAFLLGLGLGAEIDLLAFLLARHFDQRCFAELYGSLFGLFMIGSAAGPWLMGMSASAFGSYVPGLSMGVVALLAAIMLVIRLRAEKASGHDDQAMPAPPVTP